MSTTQLLEEIQNSVNQVKTDNTKIFPIAATPGDYVRQGDLYITLLEKIPQDVKLDDSPQAQLAPGASKGSRHILDSLDGVKIFKRSSASALQGPILSLSQSRTVTHPEHGDIELFEGGCFEITYQRQHAEELRRARD